MDKLIVGRIDEQSERLLFPPSLVWRKTSREEFERIALPHLSHLYTSAVYLTRDEAEAEDWVQDTYEEAAEVMECPIGILRSRVSRGRRMLQVALREYSLKRGLI